MFLLNIISVLFYSEKKLLWSPCYLTLVFGMEQNNTYYKMGHLSSFFGDDIVEETCN